MAKAQVISFINMKGGVGKTTCAVNLASYLAKEHQKRVLLVDFDPQTNASLSVMSEKQCSPPKRPLPDKRAASTASAT